MIFLFNDLNKILKTLNEIDKNYFNFSKFFERKNFKIITVIPPNRDSHLEKTFIVTKENKSEYLETEIPYFCKEIFIILIGGGNDGNYKYIDTQGNYYGVGGRAGNHIFMHIKHLENISEIIIKAGKRGENSSIKFKNPQNKILEISTEKDLIKNYPDGYHENYFSPDQFIEKFNAYLQFEYVFIEGSQGGDKSPGDGFNYKNLFIKNGGSKGLNNDIYFGGGGGGGSFLGKGGNGGNSYGLNYNNGEDASGIGAGGGGAGGWNTLQGTFLNGKGSQGGGIIIYSL